MIERQEGTVLTDAEKHLVNAATGDHTANNPFQEAEPPRSPHWWEDASCRTESAELFFPPMRAPRHEKRAAERKAKRLCFSCPVRAECLEAAIEGEERHGVWGGMTSRERRRMFGTGGRSRSNSR